MQSWSAVFVFAVFIFECKGTANLVQPGCNSYTIFSQSTKDTVQKIYRIRTRLA